MGDQNERILKLLIAEGKCSSTGVLSIRISTCSDIAAYICTSNEQKLRFEDLLASMLEMLDSAISLKTKINSYPLFDVFI